MPVVEWSKIDDPESWEPNGEIIDCGAEVLAIREENGVLIVTTKRGTFPVDLEPTQ